ncbi:MAG: aspartate/glutamate racemase family protein [Alphaproteobacteria bacterium]
MSAERIGVIHATRLSIEPIEVSFKRLWPEANRAHLLDETLLQDRRAAGKLTPALYGRIAMLANHSADAGARCVLFSCSAFGAAIEAARAQMAIPVLKPYEAMVEAALDAGPRVVALSTFGPTLDELGEEVRAVAARRGIKVALRTQVAEGALSKLEAGDAEAHDRLVAKAAEAFPDCDALMLAQYSTASAARLIPEAKGRRVLTSPDTAVAWLKRTLAP